MDCDECGFTAKGEFVASAYVEQGQLVRAERSELRWLQVSRGAAGRCRFGVFGAGACVALTACRAGTHAAQPRMKWCNRAEEVRASQGREEVTCPVGAGGARP
eukprot:3277446-Pleurochrysis_carterae.AAC.4